MNPMERERDGGLSASETPRRKDVRGEKFPLMHEEERAGDNGEPLCLFTFQAHNISWLVIMEQEEKMEKLGKKKGGRGY